MIAAGVNETAREESVRIFRVDSLWKSRLLYTS